VQIFRRALLVGSNRDALMSRTGDRNFRRCCKGFAVWVRDGLVFPIKGEEEQHIIEANFEVAVEDVQEAEDVEEVSEDFEEAATLLNKFPRGAAALRGIRIQKTDAVAQRKW
jgi:hypothetical protein